MEKEKTMRKYLVILDWIDGPVEDADDITVYARSGGEAIRKARARWTEKMSRRWPTCRLVKAWIYSG